jgi:glyoxylase-like metal-dependent hydrolase (beta-lactamase superfamily II)
MSQPTPVLPNSREIDPEELVRAAEAGEPVQVLDIRAPERLASGQLDELGAAEPRRFVNFVGSRLLALPDPAAAGLDPELPVTVVCARGLSSQRATAFLNDHGYRARSLRGGMAGWMLALVPRPLAPPPGFDRLVQFDRVGKGALGYLLISGDAAIAIDPSRNAAPLLAAAEEAGARLVAVADTHVHADYLSGGPGLARHLGVPYYLHPADAVYPYDGTPGKVEFSPLAEGQRIQVGHGELEVRHTPGHTEGSVTYVAGGRAAFTGDFLFIRSVGRPDLAGKTEAWTDELFGSLERARREWDPDLVVYPAHYASAAERRADHAVGARFGELRLGNEPLGIEDRDAFRRWVLSRQTKFPETYPIIKAVNVGLRQVDAAQAEELEAGKNECAVA